MTRILPLAIATVALTTGCATNSRKSKLANEAALSAQNHGLWTRPTEIGFKMDDEISATARATKVLGFNTGESKPGSGASLSVVSSLLGTGTSLSATGQYAAYKAVVENGAEVGYVTRVESDAHGFLMFWKNEKVTVYGRALTLDNYGPIEETRADRWRFRNHGPNTVVVTEGDYDGVNVTVD